MEKNKSIQKDLFFFTRLQLINNYTKERSDRLIIQALVDKSAYFFFTDLILRNAITDKLALADNSVAQQLICL